MTPQLASSTRQRAEEASGDAGVLKGPLKGYHHETYVLALPDGSRTVKFREPREEILWYDRRCFTSEEELLRALQGRITRIPEILEVGDMGLQGFIEGRTLRRGFLSRGRVPDEVFDQIVDLFREMARITPDMLAVKRTCASQDRPEDGDTNGFLERLVVFTEEQVYQKNGLQFAQLFWELGVDGDSFKQIRERVGGLRSRNFCLLHADLHRKNFIVDELGKLWTIDWELSMLGDPLYDLATHIYLMAFPDDQEKRMIREWRRVVERIRPGSSYGWERDLPLILDYKKAQSVFTDVIRVSLSLQRRNGTAINWSALPLAARKLQRVLVNAAVPLGLESVPGHREIMGALVRWHRQPGAGRAE
jgi:hypothetical protein